MKVVSQVEYESKALLQEHFRKAGIKHIILGETSEGGIRYYIYSIQMHSGFAFEIAIFSEMHGLKPSILAQDKLLFVGYNHEVAIINYRVEIVGKLPFGSLFYQFMSNTETPIIVAVFELGVLGIEKSGKPLWKQDTDVIIGSRLIGDKVEVRTDDGFYSFHMDDGKRIE